MKIWLCYIKAGNGHYAPAKAVAEALERQYGKAVEVKLVDTLSFSPQWIRNLIERGYSYTTNQAVWLYKFIYWFSSLSFFIAIENFLFTLFTVRKLRSAFMQDAPDCVASFHFLAGPLQRAITVSKRDIPLWMVVTDPFTTHPFWFWFHNIQYIVFSERMKTYAASCGVPKEQITVSTPIIQPVFFTSLSFDEKEAVKARHSVPLDKKIVLIAGGGNGLPHGETVLEHLLKSKIDAHIVMVCGGNQQLFSTAQRIRKQYQDQAFSLFGFVDFLPELMQIADVVISKAGASTVMETVALGKPLVITHFIWGQEKGNVDFVVENKLGFFEPDPTKVPTLVASILERSGARVVASASLENYLRRGGAEAVARLVNGS